MNCWLSGTEVVLHALRQWHFSFYFGDVKLKNLSHLHLGELASLLVNCRTGFTAQAFSAENRDLFSRGPFMLVSLFNIAVR